MKVVEQEETVEEQSPELVDAPEKVNGEKFSKDRLLHLSLEKVDLDPEYNKRETETEDNRQHLAWMMKSIQKHGIRQPIRGYRKRGSDIWTVTSGHTRVVAAQELLKQGITVDIPLLPEDTKQTTVDKLFDLVVSNSGKPLSMLEKASVVQALLVEGVRKKDIAEGFSETQANVDHLIKLQDSTEVTKQWIREGKVSASSVIDMVREVGPDEAEKEIGKLIKKMDRQVSRKDVKERNAPDAEETDVEEKEPVASSVSFKKLNELKDQMAELKGTNPDKIVFLEGIIGYFQGNVSERKLRNMFKS